MKIKILVLLVACCTLFAGVKNDAEAPTFVLMNQDSEMVDLASFKGKKVILEWTNHDCPFVKRHYDTDNMQELQREYTDNDVVWLSIISSAEGKFSWLGKVALKSYSLLPAETCRINSAGSSIHLTDFSIEFATMLTTLSKVKLNLKNFN